VRHPNKPVWLQREVYPCQSRLDPSESGNDRVAERDPA
jgi:hypothetical protein